MPSVLVNRFSSFGLKLVQNTARGRKHFSLKSKKIFKTRSQYLLNVLTEVDLVFKSVDVFSVSNLCFFN